jgi:NADPH2:quinone reductase
MRAAILREPGSPPELGETDAPTEADGQTVVEVLAAALNPVDLQLAARAGADQLPFVPGREAVARTPENERVYFEVATAPHGSFAEQALAPTDSLIAVPDGVDDAIAVAFGVAGLAGWVSLEWRAGFKPGETVLVLGAGGVVGQVAIQAAKLLGAERVVGAARSERSLERARERGADAVVDLTGDDVTGAIKEASGGGVDVIVDPVWGEPAAAALRAANRGARLVQIGEAAGAEAALAAAPLRMSQITVLGYANAAAPSDVKRAAYERMLGHAANGELRLEIDTVPLEQVTDAWRRQESAGGVKIVLTP